jgi:hypothetical protein
VRDGCTTRHGAVLRVIGAVRVGPGHDDVSGQISYPKTAAHMGQDAWASC